MGGIDRLAASPYVPTQRRALGQCAAAVVVARTRVGKTAKQYFTTMSSGTEGDDDVGKDGAVSRWALGTVVLVALAASEISGKGTIAALPLASLTVTFSAICSLERLQSSCELIKHRRERNGRDLVDFLILWMNMLTQLTAAATCARIASATMDYMSDGRSRVWLFGYESHSLGEAWPDVLGVTIIVVVTAMFMLGLENSTSFYILLNTGIVSTLIFFIFVGSMHADVSFWTHDRFLPSGWEGMLTTAAMCSYGFIDVFPESKSKYRCLKVTTYVVVPLASYCTVAIVFTLMTHFRELTETAIPMVRVFEARDVDWARPVMASCTIAVVSVALTEICPKIYGIIVTLAEHEWRILAKSLAYKNETTGSAVLAVFTAAILAFACPLSYLVRLLNVSPLMAHMLHAAAIIYDRYQPENDVEDFPVYTDVGYSRLNQGAKPKIKKEISDPTVRGLKFGLWFLPRTVRQTHSFLQDSTSNGIGKSRGQSEERECLLMGEYSPEYAKPLERLESNLDLESDSECNVESPKSSDAEDVDSSTDIDAIVEEYKEKLKVATTLTGSYSGTMRLPSLASGRRVLVSVILIFLSSVALGNGMLFDLQWLIYSSVSVMFVLAGVIAFQPQRPRVTTEVEKTYRIFLMPWLPTITVGLNALLAASLMPEIWPGIILWLGAERLRLRAPSRGSVVSTLVPSHRRLPRDSAKRLTHVDTILIAR
ncbi:torn and diminished rhabdomeres [Carabus blaptoides fortunei]